MLHSMTGYGKTLKEYQGKSIMVEMRALNSRYCDLSIKIPNSYRSKDLELRSLLTQELIRGKIDFMLSVAGGQGLTGINKDLFRTYYKDLSGIAKEVGADTSQLMRIVMQMPDVIDSTNGDLSDDEWAVARTAVHEVINELIRFRLQEGNAMQKDLDDRLQAIQHGLSEVEKLDPQRHKRMRERIGSSLVHWLKEEGHDANRFEQELLYYLEKMDVNEEMVRLRAHLDHFKQVMNSVGVEHGKILGFIAQEMGREVNTISSKANDADMQKAVVGMKDELEKVKELLLNVI